MPLVACPSCGNRLTVTGKTEGRKVYCSCGQTFLLPPREPAPEEVRAELAAVAGTMRVVAAVEELRADLRAEWLACTDPQKMLELLRGKASDRKLGLFVVACRRRLFDLDGTGPTLKEPPEAQENLADDLTGSVATDLANQYAEGFAFTAHFDPPYDVERAAQCVLLRDIFGNPFRPVAVSSAWPTPPLVALAQAAYDERELPGGTLDLTRLAVLADALDNAGCDQADLLGHLRGPGPHVRGCWAVDLILGKR